MLEPLPSLEPLFALLELPVLPLLLAVVLPRPMLLSVLLPLSDPVLTVVAELPLLLPLSLPPLLFPGKPLDEPPENGLLLLTSTWRR